MTHPTRPVRRPRIILRASEAERLSELALRAEATSPAAALLLEEIDRADIRPDARVPANVVTLYAKVEFIDERTSASRTVQLVYPHDADIEADLISVLTPVGAGLLGLSPGQAILWPDRTGALRSLRVVSVSQRVSAEV